MGRVARTILEGFKNNEHFDFPNPLHSYRLRLIETMNEVVDKSDLYAEIRESVFKMINSFCSYPEALMRLSRLCGMNAVANIQQLSLEKLGQRLMEIREQFLAVCCQQPSDQFVDIISESQW